MKKLLIIGLVWCVVGCGNRSGAKHEPEGTEKNQDIFPITSFLAGQVHQVDSLNLPLIQYITVNGKTDTLAMSMEQFKLLANEFMKPDITDPANKKFYKETSFADQSLPSITITYSTTFKDLEIQRVDVIIRPDPVANDKVQSIYMEKLSHNRDTSMLKKMYWKTDRNFQIITSTQVGSQPATFKQLKVLWSDED